MIKVIERNEYLKQLIDYKDSNLIKAIVGMRRVGKSFLLNNIFYFYLINNGIDKENIIRFSFFNSLTELGNKCYNKENKVKSSVFNKYLQTRIKQANKNEKIYIFLDEIQELENFYQVLEYLAGNPNYSVYVTGSNSNLLTNNVLKQFRGRAHTIHVYPLSYQEWVSIKPDPINNQEKYLNEYMSYGGLPELINIENEENKKAYLKNVLQSTYLCDLFEKNNLSEQKREQCLSVLKYLASTAGQDFRYTKFINSYQSITNKKISRSALEKYLSYFTDAFLIKEISQYDVRGKKALNNVIKFYFEDLGLMHALNEFKFANSGATFENLVFNTLCFEYDEISFGKFNRFENGINQNYEVDFIISNIGYFQVCWNVHSIKKLEQETKVFNYINTNLAKVLITRYVENDLTIINDEKYTWTNIFTFLNLKKINSKENKNNFTNFFKK